MRRRCFSRKEARLERRVTEDEISREGRKSGASSLNDEPQPLAVAIGSYRLRYGA